MSGWNLIFSFMWISRWIGIRFHLFSNCVSKTPSVKSWVLFNVFMQFAYLIIIVLDIFSLYLRRRWCRYRSTCIAPIPLITVLFYVWRLLRISNLKQRVKLKLLTRWTTARSFSNTIGWAFRLRRVLHIILAILIFTKLLLIYKFIRYILSIFIYWMILLYISTTACLIYQIFYRV